MFVRSHAPIFGLLVFTMMVAGCSTDRIVTQWTNPQYAEQGHAFRRIMVIGISDHTSVRRTFEDKFVQKLEAAGYDAIPSYQYIPENGKVSQERLKHALDQADADAALITRLLRVEQRVNVTPGFYEPGPYYGFYGWYSHAWSGYYEPARVYPYDVYISETTLYDFRTNNVVWSATLKTVNPNNFVKAVGNYADTVIDSLEHHNILAAR